jgi:hypothetical protein
MQNFYPSKRIPSKQEPKSYFDRFFHNKAQDKLKYYSLIIGVIAAIINGIGGGLLASASLRSVVMLIASIMIIFPAGLWLAEAKNGLCRRYRHSLFTFIALGLSCVLMLLMWKFLNAALEEQRKEAAERITLQYRIPHGLEHDPMFTIFTMKNGSKYQLSKRHGITCLTNVAVQNDGVFIAGPGGPLSSWIQHGQMFTGSGTGIFDREADSELGAYGDSQSESCLSFWGATFRGGTSCADVTVTYWWSLANQPDAEQEKYLRIVTVRNAQDKTLEWFEEPINQQALYCDANSS